MLIRAEKENDLDAVFAINVSTFEILSEAKSCLNFFKTITSDHLSIKR